MAKFKLAKYKVIFDHIIPREGFIIDPEWPLAIPIEKFPNVYVQRLLIKVDFKSW